ncbi:hypothetical protein BPOR_1075g00010 [Botrytis porri]|uniref:Uncharacterized protein n=1 Tax=Botrytis porri TaxID=87229 RepID=A0A4Z1K670_9HELO|nr:hypothetical protein BPOR_1075g00010 [Botrytis porri]
MPLLRNQTFLQCSIEKAYHFDPNFHASTYFLLLKPSKQLPTYNTLDNDAAAVMRSKLQSVNALNVQVNSSESTILKLEYQGKLPIQSADCELAGQI